VLRFVSPPDRENPTDADADAMYEVIVGVSDGVGGADAQQLSITVLGINEYAPVITSQGGGATGHVNVVQLGLDVSTVTAVDADRPAATLNYSISGGDDALLFTIDAGTGALRFLAPPVWAVPLDSDGDNIYQVQVSVSDGQFTDSQLLSVAVLPSNLHAPSITSASAVDVTENSATVVQVTAQDLDVPVQRLSFTLQGGADAALFSIDTDTGELRFLQAPDHEQPLDADQDNLYEVSVLVSDGLLSTQQNLLVRVLDANDQAPVFTGGAAFVVAENTQAVTVLSAVDADATPPVGGLVYGLVAGQDAASFVVDAATGALRFASAPDHEAPLDADADNVYELTVQVSDGVFTTLRQLSVRVSDLNDTAPVFTGGALFGVNENSTLVGQITATDPDLPPAGALSFSLTGGADASWLRIDADTGVLSFASAPDHEMPMDADGDNLYEVRVQVSDGQLSTWRDLVVRVDNVNEAPVAVNDRFVLDEDATLFGTRLDLLGNDVDVDSPTLSMRLLQGPAHGTLTIEVDGSWSYRPDADYHGNDAFTYVASDGLLDSQVATVQLQINAVNDAPAMTAGVLNLAIGPQAQWTLGDLTAQAADVESDTLSIRVVQGPRHGQLSLDQAGVLRYQADAGFSGPDDWAYVVSDGQNDSAQKLVALSVSQPGPQPEPEEPVPPTPSPLPVLPAASPGLAPLAPPVASFSLLSSSVGADTASLLLSAAEGEAISTAPAQEGGQGDAPSDGESDVATALASEALSPLPPALPSAMPTGLGLMLPAAAGPFAANGLPAAPTLDFQIGLNMRPPFDAPTNGSTLLQLLERLNLDLNDGGRLTLPLQPIPGMQGGALPTRIPFNAQSVEESRLVVLDSPVMQGSSVALSAGAVWWTARAAGLMTSMMVTVPAWRTIDPTPVMGGSVPPDADGDGSNGLDRGQVTDEQSVMEAQAADLFSSVDVLKGETEGIG
jgi:VCBS repeat-containing protein